jgi:threonylcarbamoyladenosine tRNA methylthiotransferase MtaB
MATFFIEQFGCRATQADAAAIERQLRARGFDRASEADAADIVVVNTCTVTAAADSQARRAIRAIHRRNPNVRIIATGCYAQRAPEELAALSGVEWVVGNSHKPEIPRLAESWRAESVAGFVPLELQANQIANGFRQGTASAVPKSVGASGVLTPEVGRPAQILTGDVFALSDVLVAPVEGGEADHTRPLLKIQDGCNQRCSYCVIPFVRGRSRSLTPDRVLEEIRALVARGYREVVLTGIHLGSYGRDLPARADLLALVRRILDETPLNRLRLSSIEPMDVTEDLIALVASTDRIARHFHIPLQSGVDRILAAMHRWYRAEQYARRLEWIHAWLPDAAIGADVIAGFPGETQAEHNATLEFIRSLPFTYLHVFSFSARPGTPAAARADSLPTEAVAERARDLRALGAEKKSAFLRAQISKTMRVLTLNPPKRAPRAAITRAVSSNNLEVRIAGRRPPNQFLDVRAISASPTHLEAEILPSA